MLELFLQHAWLRRGRGGGETDIRRRVSKLPSWAAWCAAVTPSGFAGAEKSGNDAGDISFRRARHVTGWRRHGFFSDGLRCAGGGGGGIKRKCESIC